ncbi:MAG: ComF family protein [Veillonellaceae bacterium]|nr:ComF family protein [Veillonellaceae bacterium]
MLKQIWETLLNIVYPPKCPGCRTGVDIHGSWCQVCLASVFAVREINVYQHRLQHLDVCYAVCEYTGGVKRLIHDIKFRQKKKYALHLEWLIDHSAVTARLPDVDIVLPVPLNTERMSERGYNQTELIFAGWANQQGWLWCETNLARTRPTKPQWELKLAERRQNVKGAFTVTHPDGVAGKNILLVDDIITSGTTMNECAKVLKKAGALRVCGLALASGAPY